MLWKKSESGLPGPKDIPKVVGRDIVTRLKGDPDRTWKDYKAVIRPKEGYKNTFEVKVFDEVQAASKKIAVKNYNSLTEHPELILYEGWFNKNWEAEIKKKE